MSEETPQDRRPLPPTDMSRTNVPMDGPSKKVSNGQGMDDRTRVLLATAIAVVALFAISAFAVFAMGSFTNVMPIGAQGATGAKGDSGPAGHRGRNGDDGPTGNRGPTGKDGATGDPGRGACERPASDISIPSLKGNLCPYFGPGA